MIAETFFMVSAFLLAYAYVLYPAAGVLKGGAAVPRRSDECLPVSVLVPAHNEASVIVAKIENFQHLDYPAELIELVIADDGSTDGTADLIAAHRSDRVRSIQTGDRLGKAAAMNALVAAAQHPVLLFTDANVMLHPLALRRMVAHLGNEQVGAVTGEVCLEGSADAFRPGESLYYVLERHIQGAESSFGSVMGVDGGMYAMHANLFESLPADTILDDFSVSMIVMRSGRRIIYESAAKATESGTPTARQEFSRRVRIAAGAVQLLKRGYVPRWTQPVLWIQFFSHKLLRWFSPVLLVVLLISNLALLTRQSWYAIAFALQVLLYVSILTVYFFPRLRKSRLGGILFYWGLSQLGIAVGLGRGLLNRQPPQWEKGLRAEDIGNVRTSQANESGGV